jgi:hypothetical protein
MVNIRWMKKHPTMKMWQKHQQMMAKVRWEKR